MISVIKNSGKEIIEISLDQMNHFVGNMLQVNNREDEKLLIIFLTYDFLQNNCKIIFLQQNHPFKSAIETA